MSFYRISNCFYINFKHLYRHFKKDRIHFKYLYHHFKKAGLSLNPFRVPDNKIDYTPNCIRGYLYLTTSWFFQQTLNKNKYQDKVLQVHRTFSANPN